MRSRTRGRLEEEEEEEGAEEEGAEEEEEGGLCGVRAALAAGSDRWAFDDAWTDECGGDVSRRASRSFEFSWTVPAAEVVSRTEERVLEFLHRLSEGEVAPMRLRTRRGALLARASSSSSDSPGLSRPPPRPPVLRRLWHRSSARAFASVWATMNAVHQLLLARRTTTLREMYYMHADFFERQEESDRAVQDLCGWLAVPRHAVGLFSSPRGLVAGDLHFRIRRHEDEGPWTAAGESALIPPAVLVHDLDVCVYSEDGGLVCVVSSSGIFRRLVDDGVCDRLGCILVTGKGVPDLATRAMVSRLHSRLGLPVLGLCDWNPFGASILATYRAGVQDGGHDGPPRFPCPIQWLGLRSADVDALGLASSLFQPLTTGDIRRAHLLLRSDWCQTQPRVAAEVAEMLRRRVKLELESLHSKGLDFLSTAFLPAKVLAADYFG